MATVNRRHSEGPEPLDQRFPGVVGIDCPELRLNRFRAFQLVLVIRLAEVADHPDHGVGIDQAGRYDGGIDDCDACRQWRGCGRTDRRYLAAADDDNAVVDDRAGHRV